MSVNNEGERDHEAVMMKITVIMLVKVEIDDEDEGVVDGGEGEDDDGIIEDEKMVMMKVKM